MGLLAYMIDERSETHPTTMIALVLLLLVPIIIWRVHLWARLSHIPGHGLAGWTVLWHLRAVLADDYHERLAQLTEKHGETEPATPIALDVF